MTLLLRRDRQRLELAFREAGETAMEGSEPNSAGSKKKDSGASMSALSLKSIHAFWEVLSFAELLEDADINSVFLGALAQASKKNKKGKKELVWVLHMNARCISKALGDESHDFSACKIKIGTTMTQSSSGKNMYIEKMSTV